MPTVSSLLRQAESARKKKQEFEDNLASFNWSVSAKTQEDYLEYADYLNNRLASVSDPSKALSYQRTLVTTRRTFIGHEIQRQAIDVLEGRQNSQGKYNVMVDLYQSAVELGDLDLAQSLRLQLDSLDRTIQAEQQKANSVSSAMASAKATSIEDTIDYIKYDQAEDGAFNYIDAQGNTRVLPTVNALKKIYENGGEESINQIADALGIQGNYWDVAGSVMEEMTRLYQDAAEVVGLNTSKGREYLKEAEKIQSGTTKFPIAPGAGNLSYQDVKDAQDASRAGQQLFIPTMRNGKNEFKKTNVTDYVWGRDENGNYKIIEVRQEFGDYFDKGGQKIKVTNAEGKTEYVDPTKAKEVLNKYFNQSSADGRYVLGTTSNIPPQIMQQMQALGISPGTSFDVVVGQDGNLRFRTPDDRIVDINLSQDSFTLSEVKKEDMSVFGDPSLNQYGRATKEGILLIKQITRQDQPYKQADLLQRGFNNLQDTTGLLSTANMTSERIRLADEERKRAQEMIQPAQQYALQQAAAGGLNTTPVPQNSRLTVQPVALPAAPLQVTQTKLPTTNLKVTNTAPNNTPLKVTATAPKPTLSVTNTKNNTNLQVR